jgi:hypothetical protein
MIIRFSFILALLCMALCAQAQLTCKDTLPARVRADQVPILNLRDCDPLFVYTKKGQERIVENVQKLERAEARLAEIRATVAIERNAADKAETRMERHMRLQDSIIKLDSVRMKNLTRVADSALDNSRKAVNLARVNQGFGIAGSILALIAVGILLIK